jgi:hypothetical protein
MPKLAEKLLRKRGKRLCREVDQIIVDIARAMAEAVKKARIRAASELAMTKK